MTITLPAGPCTSSTPPVLLPLLVFLAWLALPSTQRSIQKSVSHLGLLLFTPHTIWSGHLPNSS